MTKIIVSGGTVFGPFSEAIDAESDLDNLLIGTAAYPKDSCSVVEVSLPQGFEADKYTFVEGTLMRKPDSSDDVLNACLLYVAQTYTDIDKIIFDKVGFRATEYVNAQAAAQAYKDAGYTGTVSEYIHGYAQFNPTGIVQTDQWACDQILSQAAALEAVTLSMRNQRFGAQCQLRAATTLAGLETAISAWNQFIKNVRSQLGI
jgi:hypothetical protein